MPNRDEEEQTLTQNANLACYDEYYHKPPWWFWFRYDTQVKKKTALWLLREAGLDKRQKRVLEIGFGSGAVLFSFERDCQIAGVEVSQSAVAEATVRAQSLGFQNADFRLVHNDLLPFSDKAFDVVIASHVLEHVNDDSLLISEMSRVLDDRGVAIVIVPTNEKYADPKHQRSYTLQQLCDRLVSRGLLPSRIIQNEFLFYLVEKFYFKGLKIRWGMWGTIAAVAFNVPTSILPFWIIRWVDGFLSSFGLLPRQCGIAALKDISAQPSCPTDKAS